DRRDDAPVHAAQPRRPREGALRPLLAGRSRLDRYGVGGDGFTRTVRRSFLWASEREGDFPIFSFTVQDAAPRNLTPVFLFTPGPMMWKLSFFVAPRPASL